MATRTTKTVISLQEIVDLIKTSRLLDSLRRVEHLDSDILDYLGSQKICVTKPERLEIMNMLISQSIVQIVLRPALDADRIDFYSLPSDEKSPKESVESSEVNPS